MIGFWIFMFFMVALLPASMLALGKYFKQNAPKDINGVFGYRSVRSMQNQDTWQFAHEHFGQTWFVVGRSLLIISVILMLFVFGRDIDTVGGFGSALIGVQTVILIGSIFPTEKALKRTFDERGRRRQQREQNG